MTREELIEKLADAEHASWSHWMRYLFSKCMMWNATPDGVVALIPANLVKHWQRQMNMAYRELSEREKQSDRDEVERIMPIIDEFIIDGVIKLYKEKQKENQNG